MFKSWFAPSPRYQIQLAHQIIEITPSQTLLQSALQHGVQIPYGCKAGGCGMCKCRLISGKVEKVIENTAKLTVAELNMGIIFACCCIAKTNLQIEIITNSVVKTRADKQTGAQI